MRYRKAGFNRIFFWIYHFLFNGLVLAAFVLSCNASAAERSSKEDVASEKPLWTFSVISDMHMNETNLDYMKSAFHYVRSELKPNFVMFVGDNNYFAKQPTDPAKPEPLSLRRQQFLREFLKENLRLPYVLISADDWPEDAEKVFGPTQYSFDYGGLHFIMLDPDRIYHGRGLEGLSVFDQPTWDWLSNDLEKNRSKPTLLTIHEPICPITFLDARRLRDLLKPYDNVVAVIQGHLHVDMEHRSDGRVYLVCPSLGQKHVQAMKLAEVYTDKLIFRTISYNTVQAAFEMQARQQIVEIPKPLQGELKRPASNFVKENYSFVPAHPLVIDPKLQFRLPELVKVLMENGNSSEANDCKK